MVMGRVSIELQLVSSQVDAWRAWASHSGTQGCGAQAGLPTVGHRSVGHRLASNPRVKCFLKDGTIAFQAKCSEG